jgi:hypothetical protein
MNAPTPAASADLHTARLGETDTRFRIETREDTRRAAVALIRHAQRQVDILTPDLEPLVYDQADFLDTLTRPALGQCRAKLRVLVRDPQRAVKEGHRLIELTRRLSSYMQIRKVHTDYADFTQAFLLADTYGVMHRTLAERFEGTVCFRDPLEVKRLRKLFDEIWDRSEPDPELRRLHL